MEETNTHDRALLQSVISGGGDALAALYDRHAPAVTRYAWALAADAHDVEEILQDTFVTLWRAAARIQLVDSSVLPWLLVTCRNHAANLARKRARHRTVPIPEGLPTSDRTIAQEQLRWVMEEISTLDAIDRQVCEMCLIEGRPYQEVATLLGTSVGAIKQRVARSRARLRKVVITDEN